MSSADSFHIPVRRGYSGVGYVHSATHGLKSGFGIALIGGQLSWADVAQRLKIVAPRLDPDQQRVLTLSCCYSYKGFNKLAPALRNHFTGCYYFAENRIEFSDAMTTWAMFYQRKTVARPHQAIVDRVNGFFERKVLEFDTI